MLEIKWFSQHLNYQDFVSRCQNVFGKDKVSVFEYQGDVVQEVIQKLGLATPHDNPTPRQNNSLNSATVALLKSLNHFDMKAKDKDLLMPHIKKINEILDDYANESLIDEKSRTRVLELSTPIKFT